MARKKGKRKKSTSTKEINWSEIFFKLNYYFPNVTQFNEKNFASCPIPLIEQALSVIHEEFLLTTNYNSIAIANLGTALLKSQGVKKAKPEWFNPFPRIIDRLEAAEIFNEKTVKLFKITEKKEIIPSWVFKEYEEIVKMIQILY